MNDVWNIPGPDRDQAALALAGAGGAAAGALGWSVLQTVGVSLINRQLDQANLVYGVFAVVIVLLSWLYLSSQLVLYAVGVTFVPEAEDRDDQPLGRAARDRRGEAR